MEGSAASPTCEESQTLWILLAQLRAAQAEVSHPRLAGHKSFWFAELPCEAANTACLTAAQRGLES